MGWREYKQKSKVQKVQKLQKADIEETSIPFIPFILNSEILLPKWQAELCSYHGLFMETTGCCQREQCLCDAIIDSGGDMSLLDHYVIGFDVTCKDVRDYWLENEDEKYLKVHPVYYVLVAGQLKK